MLFRKKEGREVDSRMCFGNRNTLERVRKKEWVQNLLGQISASREDAYPLPPLS